MEQQQRGKDAALDGQGAGKRRFCSVTAVKLKTTTTQHHILDTLARPTSSSNARFLISFLFPDPSRSDAAKPKGKLKQQQQRQFDFSKYNRRHIALKFAYLGAAYHGLASQETTEDTIEVGLDTKDSICVLYMALSSWH